MANYLQRIFISGARTTSQAKPPVSSPVLVPRILPGAMEWRLTEEALSGIEPPGSTSVSRVDGQREAAEHSDATNPEIRHSHSRDELEEPQPLQRTPESEPRPSSRPMPPPPVLRSVSTPSSVVRAPRELRHSAAQGASAAQQEVSRVLEHALRGIPGQRPAVESTDETSVAARPSPPSEGMPTVEIIKAPQQVQRKPLTAPLSTPTVLPGDQASVAQEPIRIVTAPEVTASRVLPTPSVLPSISMTGADEVESRGSGEMRSQLVSTQSMADVSMPAPWAPRPPEQHPNLARAGLEIRTTPPQPVAALAVPGPAAGRRRSQISIGRIEVQVNNPPAESEAGPANIRPRVETNFLEARYLNRFSLKP